MFLLVFEYLAEKLSKKSEYLNPNILNKSKLPKYKRSKPANGKFAAFDNLI